MDVLGSRWEPRPQGPSGCPAPWSSAWGPLREHAELQPLGQLACLRKHHVLGWEEAEAHLHTFAYSADGKRRCLSQRS